jgi:hypothetical protein
MDWRRYALLALLGLALALAVAQFQRFPGYLDSDYYFGGGVQLATGKGFTEPYLWNYLDDPAQLPHPSHAYWMPLASIIAAAGLWITRSDTYQAGRLGFLFLAACVPVVTAALACSLTRRGDLAFVSGLLAVFAVYYVPFLPVPDNYGPYLLLGGLYFLAMAWRRPASYLTLGALSGLMALARSDGLLWLGLTGLLVAARLFADRRFGTAVGRGLLVLLGFLLIAGPWFLHTYSIYGTPLAPGGGHLLWLRTYDDTFAYPASQLTMQAWLAQGWQPILAARLMALRWNLLNAFAAQGEIFVLPFILAGLWLYRRDDRVRLASFAWFCLLLVMTLVFPFAGARGGFFHSGAALQPMWWTLAPVGLDRIVAAARRRGMFTPQAFGIFQAALVGLAVLMTAVILGIRVIPHWGEGEDKYPKVEAYLQTQGARPGDVVMVRNPPGYYLMTGRSAVVVPYASEASIAAAARRYDARYLVIEAAGAAGPIKDVYERKSDQYFMFLGELDGTRVFWLEP